MRKTLLALCLAAAAAPALAQETGTGEALFQSYCASCHGVDAKGDGPMAGFLTLPVPDLTMLAARNGGEFPLVKVIYTIDGRNILRGHGGPMPVFGPMTGDSAVIDNPLGGIVETRGDIVRIAEYLAGLQAD